jgi:hypothetical protein
MVLFLWKPHAIPKTKSKICFCVQDYKKKKRQFGKKTRLCVERNQQKTKLIYMEHEDDYHLKKGAIRFVFFFLQNWSVAINQLSQ